MSALRTRKYLLIVLSFLVFLLLAYFPSLYREYFGYLQNRAWKGYSTEQRMQYYEKTIKSLELLKCEVDKYREEKGFGPRSIANLVKEGYLIELPKEYETSPEGNNRVSDDCDFRTVRGWCEYRKEGKGVGNVFPAVQNWDFDSFPYVADCDLWYKDKGEAIFKDIIIRWPDSKEKK